MPHKLSFAVIDVFTRTPFTGNQLGVVRVPATSPLTKAQEHALAREFNFSETVFVHDAAAGSDERQVAIWTPFDELPFAGHPTIGTLCYIAQEQGAGASQAMRLRVPAGTIAATYDAATRRAAAEIPHDVRVHAAPVPLAEVRRTQPGLAGYLTDASKSAPLVSIVNGMNFVLVELPSVDVGLAAVAKTPVGVESVQLDPGWEPTVVGTFFYVVTAREAKATRLRARMLQSDIGEDPATGSACCTAAAYLALQRGGAGCEHVFEIEQGVEMDRASQIGVAVTLDSKGTGVAKVVLSGCAVVTMRGELEV